MIVLHEVAGDTGLGKSAAAPAFAKCAASIIEYSRLNDLDVGYGKSFDFHPAMPHAIPGPELVRDEQHPKFVRPSLSIR